MPPTQPSVLRLTERPAIHVVTAGAEEGLEPRAGAESLAQPGPAPGQPPALSIVSPSADGSADPGVFEAATLETVAAVLPACVAALEKVAKELRLTPDQQFGAMDDFLREVGGHAPHIVVTLFVRSQLPNIMESAVKHYRYKRGMSDHDAENLGQELVLKILTALTRACPRGNVGAWVRTIRSNVYWDHLRDQGRRARGMERLETAFNAMRK